MEPTTCEPNCTPDCSLEAMDANHVEYVRGLGTQTGVGIGRQSGFLKRVFGGLQTAGFSMPFILSQLFVLMDLWQEYGDDIMKIVNAFIQRFKPKPPVADVVAPQ